MSVTDLPALNATLNGISTVLLVVGYILVRQRKLEQHRRTMLAAFGTSVVFLISYVIYHLNVGSRPFPGRGAIRAVYFSILIPHVILAAAIVPLALITLSRGLSAQYDRHRAIARWTLPIWLFVSITGVLIYLMLYRMY